MNFILLLSTFWSFAIFGWMMFSSQRRHDPIKFAISTPLFFQSDILDIILTLSYPASLVCVFLSSGSFVNGLLIVLSLHFFVLHIFWGIIVGVIEGIKKRKEWTNFKKENK